MANHEYKIYVEIVYWIFQKCFELGGINPEERGWTTQLNECLNSEFPEDNHLDQKAIGDLYRLIKKKKAENITLQEMTFSERTLDLLTRFALIDDYKVLNKRFQGIEVAYRTRPFKRFDLLRIVEKGLLINAGSGWTFRGDDGLELDNNTIIAVEPFPMQGDSAASWAKVTYRETPDKQATIFFALYDSYYSGIRFSEPGKLITFFNQCKDQFPAAR